MTRIHTRAARRHGFSASVLSVLTGFAMSVDVATAAPTFTAQSSASQLATALDGPGLAIQNLTITKGTSQQLGTFVGGKEVLGIADGVFMNTGDLSTLAGPNNNSAYSFNVRSVYADKDLTTISGIAKYDPAIIEFDIVPQGDKANFVFAFGSDEYPEYVCSQFNDAFGLFMSGPGLNGTQNAAYVPGKKVGIAVNNINNGVKGSKADSTSCDLSNAVYYFDNGNGTGAANLQLDGFTKPLTASLSGLTAGQTYHVKLAIADAGDPGYDSGAFFKWLTSTNSNPVDLSLTASASSLTPAYNSEVQLTYKITNSSSIATSLVQVGIDWPQGLTWVSDDANGAFNPSKAEWDAGTIAANSSKTLKIKAKVGALASYKLMAEINYAFNEDPDSTPFNRASFANEDDTASLTLQPTVNTAPVIGTYIDGQVNNNAAVTVSVPENQTAVTSVTATDINNDPITYSLGTSGGDEKLFKINASTGQISFITAPDYELPTDSNKDNRYILEAIASDGLTSSKQMVTVIVTDVDENKAPVISNNSGAATVSIKHPENKAAVATISATDPNNDVLTYSLTSSADKSLFSLNASTGALSFIKAPDYENPSDADKNNVYIVNVAVSDGKLSATQQWLITVTDVAENVAPVITSNGGQTSALIPLDENIALVTQVLATDANNDKLSYSLSGGADKALFTLSDSGVLSFVVAADYENPTDADKNNEYLVTVTVSDGSLSTTQTITVQIKNVDENKAPVISNNNGAAADYVFVKENQTAVTTIQATDADKDPITYSLAKDNDGNLFQINTNTGQLGFINAPDFEKPLDQNKDNIYMVTVIASDGKAQTSQLLFVTITDVSENGAPIITSNAGAATVTLNVPENKTAVTTITATDPNNDVLKYSVTGGADVGLFQIGSTGNLSFITAPDYEKPTDSDKNNNYQVMVTVSDGALTTSQTLNIVVKDVYENLAPVIVSYQSAATVNLSQPENQNKVADVVANDPNQEPVSYSISGGADAALFSIDAATGALNFITAPDFENPTDANKDNTYQVTTSASDGKLNAVQTQTFNVKITDVSDTPSVRLSVKVLLQGAYRSTTKMMADDLNRLNLLPALQPYGSLSTAVGFTDSAEVATPFDYTGKETLSEIVKTASNANAPVDWVLVELRDVYDPGKRRAATAAILQRDGDIVDPVTGSPFITVSNAKSGLYYVMVRHRNHLAVMTEVPVSLGEQSNTNIDFTQLTTAVYGKNFARYEASDMAFMWAADTNNSNSLISAGAGSDASVILGALLLDPKNSGYNAAYRLQGYYSTDLNLDGVSVYTGPGNDTNLLMGNVLLHPGNSTFSGNYIVQGEAPR